MAARWRFAPRAGSLPARRVLRLLAVAVMLALAGACGGPPRSVTLRVSGSTSVSPIAAEAAEVLRARGMHVTIDTFGGSAGGIAQLAAGQIDVAMSSKPLDEDTRLAHPDVDFVATPIGSDALGVIVDAAVYEAGVTDLSSSDLRRLFAGEIRNWTELGGPDLPVFVYQKEPGRGSLEVLIRYLYPDGDAPDPPTSERYAIVGGNEEARSKLASTPGAVGPLSVPFAESVRGLAAVAVDGVTPTREAIRDGTYPLSRPLLLLTDGPPRGAAAEFIEFLGSAQGQALVEAGGFLRVDQSR